jgi:hypothetical protein
VNASANGYRLPVEKEWEWAARGGVSSQGYHFYSGSNDVNVVAWIFSNSSDGAKVVGSKAANELAIHDMSGNVFEWCWDVYDPFPSSRRLRGGSWQYDQGYCTVYNRDTGSHPDYRDGGIGFRLARNMASSSRIILPNENGWSYDDSIGKWKLVYADKTILFYEQTDQSIATPKILFVGTKEECDAEIALLELKYPHEI